MTKTRHIICCDGTWNTWDSKYPTNVRRMAEIVSQTDDNGVRQIVYYDDGVGTHKGGVGTTIYNVAAAAFGWGLNDKIRESYKTLCQNFNANDEIYLVGYSRGAYTARSLGGLIRKCGLSDNCSDEVLKKAMEIYRRQDDTPDTEAALQFRAQFSTRFVVGDQDIAWRNKNMPGFNENAVSRLRIKFLAVMDTVGALGLPEGGKLDFLKFWNKKYRFHNTNASSMYENICHVVALNETRTTFPPTMFSNLDELNGKAGASSDDFQAPYKELWSPGVHGSVGGGGEIVGLSHSVLLLLAHEMERAGLVFNRAALGAVRSGVDVMAPFAPAPGIFSKIAKAVVTQKDRVGPASGRDIAPATIERWNRDPEFRRSPSLKRVSEILSRQQVRIS